MTERKSPTWQARIAAEKRADILDAATRAFLKDGYDRTTLEQIAKGADVSTGTLFKHFPTKAALFGAIMARVWDNEPTLEPKPAPKREPVGPAPGDPRRCLAWIGADYARLLRAPSTVPLFRVVIAEAPRFPELGRELYERGKAPYLARLRVYLEAEIAAGALAIEPDQIATAEREFLGMINDQIFWPRLLIVDMEVSDADVEKAVASAVETFLKRYGA